MNILNLCGYVRVSGRGQVDGDGPDRQREKILGACRTSEAHCDMMFEENAVSGTVEALDRPAFAEMLDWIEGHNAIAKNPQSCLMEPCIPIVGIIVERMDRLARDLMVSEFLLAECRKRGLKVFAVDQGLTVDLATNEGDPTQKLIRQILGALAEWEKSALVAKLRAARQRVKAKTGRCEGNKPYGHTPDEKRILAAIQTWRKCGESWRFIAGQLNAAGFKTRKGTEWSHSDVASIYKNSKETKADV